MKLSTSVGLGGDPAAAARYVRDLESVGVDSVFVPELYGFDAVSLIGYLAASTSSIEIGTGILNVYSRTPALLAMTAAGLDRVTGGRFILGLGTSGPQVVEGWHAVEFDQPLVRTREVIDVCRLAWRREVVRYKGYSVNVPLVWGTGTGLGKALKLIDRPVRDDIPIYLAALGHRNVRLAAEMADGWIPALFHPDRAREVWGVDLDAGRLARTPDRAPLEIVAGGMVAICDDDTAARLRDRARPAAALYVGGMGARGKNFYNNVFRRYGYEEKAAEIQDLYLAGHKRAAAAEVPEEYLAATNLVGDEGHVRDRVEAYREAGVTRLSVRPVGENPLHVIEKVREWAA